jgi:hypothetical protein
MLSVAIRCLERHYGKGLIAIALATAAAGVAWFNPGLRKDYTLGSFVGGDNVEFEVFESFMSEFSGSELAIIALRSEDAMSRAAMECLSRVTEESRSVGAVAQASSLADIPAALRRLWLDHPLVSGLWLSTDHKTTSIILRMHPENHTGNVRPQTVQALREIVAEAQNDHPDIDLILTGPYVTMFEMFELVRRDQEVFAIAMLGLMLITLAIIFGRWRPAAIAMGTAFCATLCTLGLAIVADVNLSLQSQLVVVMVTALVVATVVHLAVAHNETLMHSAGQADVGPTLQRMVSPCTAVMLTSALGFASVAWSDLGPIRVFGVVMAAGLCGAGVACFCTAFLLPREQDNPPPRQRLRAALVRGLLGVAHWPIAAPRRVIAAFAVATVVLAWPIPKLQFDSEFVHNFREESPVRRGYGFVERNLAPLSSIEVLATPRDDADPIQLHAVEASRALTDYAVATFAAIPKALSVADALCLPGTSIPTTPQELSARRAAVAAAARMMGVDVLSAFTGKTGRQLRVSILAREGLAVEAKLDMCRTIHARAQMEFGEGYDVRITGLYPFYASLIHGLLQDQRRSFALALTAIFLTTLAWFRSVRVAAVAMIPNVLPMIACLGVMGWLNIPVNMATAMMLSIALGIAVDDTMHYLWRYRHELGASTSVVEALQRTHASVGLACLFTTIVLALGFWVLCFSQFVPMAYFGALVGITMLCALASDLVLLPAILRLWPGLIKAPAP